MWLLDFHPRIESDLAETAEWYERQQPGLGDRLLDEAAAAFRLLPRDALHYAVRLADIRRLNLPSFPIGIYYFVADDAIVILAVAHAARDLRAELENRRKDRS